MSFADAPAPDSEPKPFHASPVKDEVQSESRPSSPPKSSPFDALARFAWPLAFVGVAAMAFGHFRPTPPPPSPTSVIVERPAPVVMHELRALGRLETAAIHVEKVVDVTDHQARIFGLVEADDSLLFVASGELVLGVDLSKITEGDARFDAATKTAFVRLPEPELFSSRLDEVASHVHVRTTHPLAKKNDALESIARKQALAAFEAAAHEPHAVELARAQAERQLRALAKAWGADDLVLTWRDGTKAELEPLPVR